MTTAPSWHVELGHIMHCAPAWSDDSAPVGESGIYSGRQPHTELDALADIAPALAHHVVAYGFGEVYARPGLTPPQRQLVTLGMLTALGGCEPQLEVHVNASLNVGLSPVEIIEALTHAAVYCGFPKALNAVFVAKRVFAARGLLPVQNPQAT
jgi:4-carboxymuconolactone decarboxylase